MKKVTLLAAVALMVVTFAATVFAAPAQGPAQTPGSWYCPYYGQSNNELTDDQKAQVNAWRQQMLEQRKQMLQKQVEWGHMTQAQADERYSWMEQHMANGASGFGHMGKRMHGGMGRGVHGGMGCW